MRDNDYKVLANLGYWSEDVTLDHTFGVTFCIYTETEAGVGRLHIKSPHPTAKHVRCDGPLLKGLVGCFNAVSTG
jgi:hypothetical protein